MNFNSDNSLVYEHSHKSFKTSDDELSKFCDFISDFNVVFDSNSENNLSNEEKEALNHLKCNDNIILKQADKGGAWVILNKTFYRDKLVLADHLNSDNYIKIDSKCDTKLYGNMKKFIKNHSGCFTSREFSYLNNFDWKSSNFYVLPKIHKSKIIHDLVEKSDSDIINVIDPPDLKGRPIVAGPMSPTHRLCLLLDRILKPLLCHIKSYIKDDLDFIRKLPVSYDYECTLYSVDIVSLYTSIPLELGLEAMKFWVYKYRDEIPARFTSDFIFNSIEFVMKNNNFVFNDEYYNQVNGTGMGINCAPVYACLSIGYLEENKLYISELPKYFTNSDINLIVKIFLRYIDDGFLPWPNHLNFEEFFLCLNNLHPAIKFTYEKAVIVNNCQNLGFLDILIIMDDNFFISTDIFYKPTASHDYLSYLSSHPSHTKNNIPYVLAKKIIVFVSDVVKMNYRLNELKQWLLDCHYPIHIISQAFFNAKLQGPAPLKNKNKDIYFTTVFSNNFNAYNSVNNLNYNLKNLNSTHVQNVFSNSRICVSYKQPKNLLRILTSARFSENIILNTAHGVTYCNDTRCNICKLYLKSDNPFITSNGTHWFLKTSAHCSSDYVIYFLTCLICKKETYIGKTIGDTIQNRGFRVRMNKHISDCRYIDNDINCKFPKHVLKCRKVNPSFCEPFFSINIMMANVSPNKIDMYERHLQKKGHDTLNR